MLVTAGVPPADPNEEREKAKRKKKEKKEEKLRALGRSNEGKESNKTASKRDEVARQQQFSVSASAVQLLLPALSTLSGGMPSPLSAPSTPLLPLSADGGKRQKKDKKKEKKAKNHSTGDQEQDTEKEKTRRRRRKARAASRAPPV